MKLLPVSLVLACSAVLGTAAAADKVTFEDHVLPIFRNACNNCHNPDKKKAGLDLTTYQATMQGSENGQILKPGNADGSLLLKCVLQTEEPKMPPKGDKLSDGEIGMIKNWIAGFALETASSKPAAASQNKVEAAVVSLTRPEGPAPMPGDLPLEPYVRTTRTNALVALAASPWAPLVAVGGQRQIILYNTETLQPLGVLPFPEGFPTVIRFSRNGKLLLTGGGLGGKQGKVVLWDIATGERIGTVGNEVDQVLGADLSPDQQHVALGGPTRVLKIYSTKDGKLEHSIKKHTDWVTAVAFSPDGRYLASADRSGGVVVWEGATGKEFNTLAGHKVAVTALAFMPGVLASASADGKIVLWDVKEGKEIRSWAAHGGGVEFVDFTPDGRLVSCGRDKVAKAWDQTGKVLATSEQFGDIALRAVLNSERVVAGDWSGEIRVYGLDGKRVGALSANPPPIADQLAVANKRLADAEALIPAQQKAVADAEAKIAAELAAALSAQKNAQAALDAARTAAEPLEKRCNDERGKVGPFEQAAAAGKTAAQAAQAAFTAKQGANAPAPEIEEAKKEFDARTAAAAEAQRKLDEQKTRLAKTEAELKTAKAEQPAKIAAAQKALDAANGALATAQGGAAPDPQAAAKVAELKKSLDALNAEVTKLREARAQKKEGTPEYNAANDAVQAKKSQIAKVQEESDKLAQTAATKLSPSHEELAKARAALDRAKAEVAEARTQIDRWTRAQSFMAVHQARQTFAARKASYEELVRTAKDALLPVTNAEAQLAANEKAAAEGPAKIKAAEEQVAQAAQARDAAAKTLADARAALAAIQAAPTEKQKAEAAVAELTKKIAAVNAEIATRRQTREAKPKDTPEYQQADAAVQALKPDLAKLEADLNAEKAKLAPKPNQPPAPELVAAQEAVKKGELDAKLAADKVPLAEKALAKVKADVATAGRLAAELRQKLPELTKAAAATKARAEADAVTAARDLEAAKAASERARADYDKRWQPVQKTASTQ